MVEYEIRRERGRLDPNCFWYNAYEIKKFLGFEYRVFILGSMASTEEECIYNLKNILYNKELKEKSVRRIVL